MTEVHNSFRIDLSNKLGAFLKYLELMENRYFQLNIS